MHKTACGEHGSATAMSFTTGLKHKRKNKITEDEKLCIHVQ